MRVGQECVDDGRSAVIDTEEPVKNDYNLSFSRYVSQHEQEEALSLEDAMVQLQEAEEERTEADRKQRLVLQQLGLDY